MHTDKRVVIPPIPFVYCFVLQNLRYLSHSWHSIKDAKYVGVTAIACQCPCSWKSAYLNMASSNISAHNEVMFQDDGSRGSAAVVPEMVSRSSSDHEASESSRPATVESMPTDHHHHHHQQQQQVPIGTVSIVSENILKGASSPMVVKYRYQVDLFML